MRELFDAVKPHEREPELVAVRQFFVVHKDLSFVPFMNKVKKRKQLVNIIWRIGCSVAYPFTAPFFSVSRGSSGKIDGFFIVGRGLRPEFNGDFKFFGLGVGMKNSCLLYTSPSPRD